jgi:hypothetical protein
MPRKPFEKLKPGNVAHNADKYRKDGRLPSTQPEGELGPPSPFLTAAAKEIWKQLVDSAPSGLGESDRALLEMACDLRLKVSKGKASNSEMATLLSIMKSLGFVPKYRKPREPGASGSIFDLLKGKN